MSTHETRTKPSSGTATDRFAPFERKMLDAALDPLVIDAFRIQYERLVAGATGLIGTSMIRPVEDLPDADTLTPDDVAAGHAALPHVAVIKLNGGLGTSMGLERAKSLIEVRDDRSFLDITALQLERLSARTGVRVPLVLMNSFSTRSDSLAALARYGGARSHTLPADFMQHMVPKVLCETLEPAVWPAQPALEWCPPGHGDMYTALVTSGLLAELRRGGFHHIFVSNADNLGAVLDPAILGHIVRRGIPFLMEVADRTIADRKGGHLARSSDGTNLLLRESAQCPPDEADDFQNIERHRSFNTNSIWIELAALDTQLARHGGVLPLPLIRNVKTLDPRDPASPAVYQLETAMGAAIALFDGAAALRVPRVRFAPVKTSDDLLALWSDACILDPDGRVRLDPSRSQPPAITLDPRYFRMIDDLHARLPFGAPSLIACERLEVMGDVVFGRNIVVRGSVRIAATEGKRLVIADNTVLDNEDLRA